MRCAPTLLSASERGNGFRSQRFCSNCNQQTFISRGDALRDECRPGKMSKDPQKYPHPPPGGTHSRSNTTALHPSSRRLLPCRLLLFQSKPHLGQKTPLSHFIWPICCSFFLLFSAPPRRSRRSRTAPFTLHVVLLFVAHFFIPFLSPPFFFLVRFLPFLTIFPHFESRHPASSCAHRPRPRGWCR